MTTSSQRKAETRRAVARQVQSAYAALHTAGAELNRAPLLTFTRTERSRVQRALRAAIRAVDHFTRDI